MTKRERERALRLARRIEQDALAVLNLVAPVVDGEYRDFPNDFGMQESIQVDRAVRASRDLTAYLERGSA